jgi:topoisomerase-4 subunit A
LRSIHIAKYLRNTGSDKPRFMSVNDMLTESTFFTKELLKQELEIKLKELMEKIFFSSLLKIFIQEGMYKHPDYEQSSDFEGVLVVLNRCSSRFSRSSIVPYCPRITRS